MSSRSLAALPAKMTAFNSYISARFEGGQEAWAQAPHQRGAPTMFMCLAICATCACHLVIFREGSLFVDAINYIGRPDCSISLEEYLIL